MISVLPRATTARLQRLVSPSTPLLLFLDVDGTLAPIVPVPSDAAIPSSTLTTLKALACTRNVAIILISGRSKPTLVTMMGGEEVENISFASSHGHFIELSQSLGGYTHVVGEEVKPLLRIAETALLAWLTTIAPAGLTLENTGLSISLHYRNLVGPSPERLAIVEAAVDEVVACSKGVLEKRVGKLVWEIRPSLGWGKGKALLWVIEKTKALLGENLAVLCCGDDATDEDMFSALSSTNGLPFETILVSHPLDANDAGKDVAGVRQTSATLFTNDTEALAEQLKCLATLVASQATQE